MDGKFIGSMVCEKDREAFGYYGRLESVLSEDIVLDNKKKIRSGTLVTTMLLPLCGRAINNDSK